MEARDDTRKETAHADEQALEGAVTYFKGTGTPRKETREGTGTTDEEPALPICDDI